MKNKVLAAAIGAALCLSTAAHGASDEELARINEKLQVLMERMDRLEQENAALKAQNQALQSQPVAAAPKSAADAAKPSPPAAKPVDWPSRIAVKGDLRYRHQQTDDERQASERDEHLLRVRLNVEAKINETMTGVIGIATSAPTGNFGNPRGANVQLDGEFSRKPLYLDLGYIDWTFAEGAHAIGGKMKMPFVRPGQSLFWDNDINPEGIALTYGRGPWFASGWGYWVEENVQWTSTANALADTTDTKMYGAQFGGRFDLGGASNVAVAAMYYDLAAAEGRRPFFNNSSNGNTTNGNSMNPMGGLAFDYQVIQLMAEYNAKFGDLPFQAWVDVAQNQDAELDTAFTVGALFGKASNPGSWEAGLAYQVIEKDALFAQHIDGDFLGLTDSNGWILRGGYAPFKNWSVNATYFKTQGNMDVGNEFDFDRLMLDVNAKF